MAKVLVTGSTGFIGKNLVKKLVEKGYEVHALERYVTGRYSLDQNMLPVVRHYVNLTDYHSIKDLIGEIKPDYVIHLAGVTAVAFSYNRYIEVSEVNYIATANLAEACYREVPNFKQFLLAGTSENYGMSLKGNNTKLTEESELVPNSPYAVAKIASEYYLRYMGLAYSFPYTIMRPFNTYGRTDNSHFFIERTITQMLKGGDVTLGDPNTVRDWVYVDDHVNGYLRALGNKNAIGQILNIGTGKAYTTKETADIIAKMIGYKGRIKWNTTPKRPLDAAFLIGDSAKAKRLIGWEAQYTLEEGLKKTIEYWRGAVDKGVAEGTARM